tara:strand:+ start:248 stop:469 length:222 start_codon:yes stop_codon:yes gene_type:complete
LEFARYKFQLASQIRLVYLPAADNRNVLLLDRNVDDWRGANFQAKKKSSRDSTETLKTGTANEQRWAEGGTRI